MGIDNISLERVQIAITVSNPDLAVTKSTADLVKDDETEQTDTRCGYTSSCKPACLQKFANPKAFMVLAFTFMVIQGFAINGVNNVNIPSYERQFQLTSAQSSLIASINDVGAGVLVIFVGYYGGKGHQPRIIASSALAMGVGCLIMSLAYFTSPPYEPEIRTYSLMCQPSNGSTTECNPEENEKQSVGYQYILLLIGQLINGYTSAVLFSLGVTYIDQSLPAEVAPLYVGIMVGGSIVGPAIGFIGGGALTKLYVNFPQQPPDGLTTEHPAWVGAWWLGLIISAVLCFIIAPIISCFPKELPGTAEIRANKVSQAHNDGTEKVVNKADFGLTLRDLPKATWFLLKNPAFLFVSLGRSVEFIIIAGYSSFLPKIIANQFNTTVFLSSVITGIMSILGAVAGQISGGYIAKRMKLKMKGLIRLSLISTAIVLICCPVFLARCPNTKIAGISAAYPSDLRESGPFSPDLESKCNVDCGCSSKTYDPVCADGIQYFTPCHAGCNHFIVEGELEAKIYQNCSCPELVKEDELTVSASASEIASSSVVKAGHCKEDCYVLYYAFLPVGFLLFFGVFLGYAPSTIAILRAVPEKQRTYAVSLDWAFIRFVGTIPGPIVLGAAVDATCLVWEDSCADKGSCWIYDNEQLSYYTTIVIAVFSALKMTFLLFALNLYKPQEEHNDKSNIPSNGTEKSAPVTSNNNNPIT